MFLLLGVFLMTTACASTPQKRSFGEIIDDSMLHTRLKARFLTDKTIKPGDIKIEVRKGVVSMNGVLGTQEEIDRAIEIAERTKGVQQVKAYLVLRSQQEAGVVTTNNEPVKKQRTTKSERNTLNEETISETLP